MIKYSIIICSYNRYNFLVETIESILYVLKPRNDYEILIIDNNSKDETIQVKDIYNSNEKVKYFLELKQGLSYARNRGMLESKGEILIYLDDDIEIVNDYFVVCDELFDDKSISIVGGKVLPFKVNIPTWIPKKYYFLVSIYDQGEFQKEVTYVMGGNFAIRSIVAEQIGLYNTSLGRNGKSLGGGEEIDYQNRARNMGFKIIYHPKLNILHKINEKLNLNYILEYANKVGESERIIDSTVSKLRIYKKIIKSYMAFLIYHLFGKILSKESHRVYVQIINEYGKGYIKRKS